MKMRFVSTVSTGASWNGSIAGDTTGKIRPTHVASTTHATCKTARDERRGGTTI